LVLYNFIKDDADDELLFLSLYFREESDDNDMKVMKGREKDI